MSRVSEIAVGSLKVVALRDGELFLPSGALVNLSEQDLKTISNDENSRLAYSNVNAYLVQSKDQNLLVDSGCRDLFGPTCGFVQEALKEAGLVPSDITDIFLTHLHPDHIAGTIDTDGTAVFENATLKVLDLEYNFWSSQDFDETEVNGADWANLAKAVLHAYKDRLETLSFDSDIAPGVSSVSIPGHTPGHSGFRVDDGRESLIQMGDLLHVPNLQLINPNVATVFDIDPEAALKSRREVLDMVSTDKMLCTSGHMLDQKFGHLEKNGTGYIFIA